MEFEEDEDINTIETFDEIELNNDILRGIFAYGWDKPSDIQKKAILPMKSGRDIIAQAQSGTGKSGSFVIGCLTRVNEEIKSPQVLILSNVHDLAIQTYNLVQSIIRFTKLESTLVIGRGLKSDHDNYSQRRDIPPFKPNAQIVVGTPGRVIHFLKNGKINNSFFKTIVIDEADEMLGEGFQEQIKTIFENLPEDIQVTLFSATMPPQILALTKKFMNNPIRILIQKETLTLEGIQQFYVGIESDYMKFEVLKDLYGKISVSQAIIFVNSKPRLINLKSRLEQDGYTISIIHGGMNQYERNDIIEEFKLGKTRILISTDILSRGIDIQQISLVINYDIPNSPEKYIHRIGRSGRYGRRGVGINLVTSDEYKLFRAIQVYYSTQINPLPQNYQEIIRAIS